MAVLPFFTRSFLGREGEDAGDGCGAKASGSRKRSGFGSRAVARTASSRFFLGIATMGAEFIGESAVCQGTWRSWVETKYIFLGHLCLIQSFGNRNYLLEELVMVPLEAGHDRLVGDGLASVHFCPEHSPGLKIISFQDAQEVGNVGHSICGARAHLDRHDHEIRSRNAHLDWNREVGRRVDNDEFV